MVSHYFEAHRGGIEIVAGRLVRELQRLGCTTVWAATGKDGPSSAELETVPLSAWNGTERIGVPLPIPSPGAIRRLIRATAGADAIIVHDALYPTSVIALLTGRLKRKPVMIVQHIGAIEYRNPILRLIMRAANRLVARVMLRAADQVVFISETTRAHFPVRTKLPPATIFNGVDDGVFRPAADAAERSEVRRALGLSADTPVALFVGRFVEKKGLALLRRLTALHPEMVWAFAGWGPLDPAEWNQANVRVFRDLTGESLARLYRGADLLVLPSTGEGFPLVIQEALASGLPVVCGKESAAADPAATSLLTGMAIDPGDEAATAATLSAAVQRALIQPDDGGARRRFAQDHYSWNAAARRYRDLIEQMIARKAHWRQAAPAGHRNGP